MDCHGAARPGQTSHTDGAVKSAEAGHSLEVLVLFLYRPLVVVLVAQLAVVVLVGLALLLYRMVGRQEWTQLVEMGMKEFAKIGEFKPQTDSDSSKRESRLLKKGLFCDGY